MHLPRISFRHLFFFNDTATTEIYTLSLHDALPISSSAPRRDEHTPCGSFATSWRLPRAGAGPISPARSEEHTSELQSPDHLVCRLLLEKKKKPQQLLTISQQKHSPITRLDIIIHIS